MMKKEDVNKKNSSTWTKINDNSKSKHYKRLFIEEYGGEFVQMSRLHCVWEESSKTPEPEIKIKPKIKAWVVTRPNGKLDEITNLSKYCKEHKLDDGAIYRVLNGQRNHHKGYKIQKKEID